ncbi:MAG: M24 family metallopeptidase [Gemmatimonadaceae bacterium]|nr:M24 family metallopeptidase [Gemmatimonadaceae bacterium]
MTARKTPVRTGTMRATPGPETRVKLERVREYLDRHRLSGVVLATRGNVAWLTAGGDAHVVSQSDEAVGAIVVTAREAMLVTSEIEVDRLQHEEPVRGLAARTFPWTRSLAEAVTRVVGRDRSQWASDHPLATALAALPGDFASDCRASLLPDEIERYEALGRDCRDAIEATCRALAVGETEHDVEARCATELLRRGVQPHVLLVGADARIRNFRHPIPTARTIRRHVMVVVCGQRHGLIASLTRFVHFGALPKELANRHLATCRVEAAMWEATQPGTTFGAIVAAGQRQYAKERVPDEWMLHHQGGPTGYAGRDFVAAPGEERAVQPQQAVAWNPSITGTKSEDTFIVMPPPLDAPATARWERLVVTAASPAWPVVTVTAPAGARLVRPAILVR